ncbi:DnaJ-like protein subfamily B member 8 [Psilocybe cubensis]|uniref:J domain-containing protein n=2 Tax=Psilocybe cubensis TaxID=181762 RepID=A0A8H7XT31_PSICU|nr:DnaJ-like protein subfamily B member 8 [Psilocybe cubensis]KAH9479496.1 DnaJ-like protein subfamily B member 8 [Psilocybe cubensis]
MSGLYEELGISKDASPEQIRKAYKKRALQTHPDRLPPNATPADKTSSEEKFRRVNNAYEVLSDPKKRAEYDIHGVWPPPEAEEIHPTHRQGSRSFSGSRRPSRNNSFPDPFFPHHHSPFSAFEFTDPFELFNSIFEGDPFFGGPSRHRHPSFSPAMDPFAHMHRMQAEIESFMDNIDRDPFSMSGFPRFGFMPPIPTAPAIESSAFNNNRGKWVSESFMTSTVNGVTQTIRKRVDSNGNEHILRTLPDGREVRTINGVEQHPAGHIPPLPAPTNTSKSRRISDQPAPLYLPPDTVHPQPMVNPSGMAYGASPPPPPPPYSRHSTPTPIINNNLGRKRRSSEKCADPRSHEDRQRKKRWWH